MRGVCLKHSGKTFFAREILPPAFWILLTALPVVATFAFSSQNAQTSGGLSMRILRRILSLFPFLTSFASVRTLHKILRKLAHFSLYFCLGCGLRGLFSYQRRIPAVPGAIVAGAAYAALDELHQRFTSGRSPQLTDVLIDACGVIAGCALVSLLFFLFRKRRVRAS